MDTERATGAGATDKLRLSVWRVPHPYRGCPTLERSGRVGDGERQGRLTQTPGATDKLRLSVPLRLEPL